MKTSRMVDGVIGLSVLSAYYAHRPIACLSEATSREWSSAREDSRTAGAEATLSRLLRVDVVSFDLLDTLVTRSLATPGDIHDAVELRAAQEGIRLRSWRETREAAEARARQVKGVADVTLAEIYAALAEMLPVETSRRLSELEIEIEIGSMTPTTRGRLLYEHARAAGKKIVIASDMYLPKAALERCLEKCGYDGWDLLLVSGDDGVSKYEGSTFRLVQERFSGRILHIGDNLAHDVRNARRAGIESIHLPAPAVHRARSRRYAFKPRTTSRDAKERVAESLTAGLSSIQAERRAGTWTDFGEAGYSILGPILLDFALSLQHAAIDSGATRFHFLAREGRILRRAYEAAVPQEDQLPSTYALLSSRVTSMAALGPEPTVEARRFLFKTPVALPLRAYLTRVLGPDSSVDVDAALRDRGFDPGVPTEGDDASTALSDLVDDFWPRLHSVASRQRVLLTKYLGSIGIDDRAERPLLVDVGWGGTIQRALENVTALDLDGYYMCLVDDERTRSTPRLDGWIDARRGGSDATAARAAVLGHRVLEVLMAAPDEGSVASFEEAEAGKSVPRAIRLGLEFPPRVAGLIDDCQNEALRFIADFREASAALGLDPRDGIGSLGRSAMLQLLARPSRRQLDDFAPLPFDGSYGERTGVVGPWGAPALVKAKLDPGSVRRMVRTRVLGRLRS